MKKRVIFNRRKFISRITGLTLLVMLAVVSYLSMSGSLTADALNEPQTYAYQVESGDTLWAIAKRIQAPKQDIREVIFEISQLNALSSSTIHPGQILMLPEEVPYEL